MTLRPQEEIGQITHTGVSCVNTDARQGTKRPRRSGSGRGKRPGSVRRLVIRILLLVAALAVLGAVLLGCSVALSAPRVTELNWQATTVFYDREGNEFYRFHGGENRTPVTLEEIPDYVVDAFLAIEDPQFYDHFGISIRGTFRAVWRTGLYILGLPGGRIEGGSTITQQLARDGWLTQEVTIGRKLQEAWVAIQLERAYTKDEILEMYLNQIYYGHGAYGIEAAAKTFFGKDVGSLTLAEGAQLAGMINGPSIYDPYIDPDASLERRNLVLDMMVKEGMLSQAEAQVAKEEVPVLSNKAQADLEGSAFTDYVINILQNAQPGLAEKYGINLGDAATVATSGLKVYTTLDSRLQKLAEQAVTEQMAAADQQYGLAADEERPEAAMVVMNPANGHVLAMVGGRSHDAMLQFNRATDALRQPGSAIKPLVDYAPAIEEAGLSPATILDDAPVMLSQDGTTVWPQNYNYVYEGLKPARYGIEQSVNPMAVRALQMAGGPEKGIEYARRFGLSTIDENDNHLALALGGIAKGVTVLDMTTAYATIANMGIKVEPVVITKIEDAQGRVLFEASERKSLAIKPSTAYLLIDMMKDVIRKGTAYGFTGGFKGWPAAGKTGTTEFNRDSWFVGFTTNMVATVWNGYDDPDHTLPWTGAFVPVKIWNQFMTQAVTEKPADWARPSDVVDVKVCRLTGAVPNSLCPKDQVTTDLFVRGTEPTDSGNILVEARVVKVTTKTADGKTKTEWQLWQAGCGLPTKRTFIQRPQPRAVHPTDPYNPKYVPQDAGEELPTTMCTPSEKGGGIGDWWDEFFDDDKNGNQKNDGSGSSGRNNSSGGQNNSDVQNPGGRDSRDDDRNRDEDGALMDELIPVPVLPVLSEAQDG